MGEGGIKGGDTVFFGGKFNRQEVGVVGICFLAREKCCENLLHRGILRGMLLCSANFDMMYD